MNDENGQRATERSVDRERKPAPQLVRARAEFARSGVESLEAASEN